MLKSIVKLNQTISQGKKKAIGNILWLLADRVLQMGLSLFVGLWVARYLGPQQFGSLNYAMSFVGLFSIFASLGLDSIVVRDLVKEPSKENEILGTSFVVQLAASLGMVVLSLAAIAVFRPNDFLAFSLVAILATGSTFKAFNVIEYWFRSRVEARQVVVSKNLAYLFICVIRIYLIYRQAPLWVFACAVSGEILLSGAVLTIFYQAKTQGLQQWNFSIKRAKLLFQDCLPMVVAGAATTIYMKTDSIMIGQALGDGAVGLYAAAIKIAEMWYFVPTMVVSTIFPTVIKMKAVDNKEYVKRAEKLFTMVVTMAYTIAIGVTLLSHQIIELFYGDEYSGAGLILSIYVWSGLFVSLGIARGPWMIADNLLRFRAIAGIAGAVLNVALNLALIRIIGIMGAAISTIASQAITCYLINGFNPKTLYIFKGQTRSLLLLGLPGLVKDIWIKIKAVLS